MSWKLPSTRRFEEIKYELKVMEDRWAKGLDKLKTEIEDRIGGKVFVFSHGEKMEGLPTENVCDRLDSLEYDIKQLVEYLQVEEVTTQKKTVYRKKLTKKGNKQ